MRFLKGLMSVINILANIVHIIINAIEGALLVVVGFTILLIGAISLSPEVAGFGWLAMFMCFIFFLEIIFNIVFGIILSKKRSANIISIIGGGMVLLGTLFLYINAPVGESGSVESLGALIAIIHPFFIVHIILFVIYVLKLLFNLRKTVENTCPNCGVRNRQLATRCKNCDQEL
ncbi:MAG: hypothetical protein LBR37_04710 [Erysipelotrichaceae bacterium]|jgi:hypothetical protein|nr:hypothetical protein [Erysipelotrichaceae bacterium]